MTCLQCRNTSCCCLCCLSLCSRCKVWGKLSSSHSSKWKQNGNSSVNFSLWLQLRLTVARQSALATDRRSLATCHWPLASCQLALATCPSTPPASFDWSAKQINDANCRNRRAFVPQAQIHLESHSRQANWHCKRVESRLATCLLQLVSATAGTCTVGRHQAQNLDKRFPPRTDSESQWTRQALIESHMISCNCNVQLATVACTTCSCAREIPLCLPLRPVIHANSTQPRKFFSQLTIPIPCNKEDNSNSNPRMKD